MSSRRASTDRSTIAGAAGRLRLSASASAAARATPSVRDSGLGLPTTTVRFTGDLLDARRATAAVDEKAAPAGRWKPGRRGRYRGRLGTACQPWDQAVPEP